MCLCITEFLTESIEAEPYLLGERTSKQNLLSPSTTGLTVQSRKSSSMMVTSSPVSLNKQKKLDWLSLFYFTPFTIIE